MAIAAAAVLSLFVQSTAGAATLRIYREALENGWQDYSSEGAHSLDSTDFAHGGSRSISLDASDDHFVFLAPPAALQTAAYTHLDVWVNGGAAGGQKLAIGFQRSDRDGGLCETVPLEDFLDGPIEAGAWKLAHVRLQDLGADGLPITGFGIANAGGANGTVYLDDVALVTDAGPSPVAGPSLSIDAAHGRARVSPDIYGVNVIYGDFNPLSKRGIRDLGATLNRWGGNAITRYDWTLSASNRASDYFFENLPEDGPHAVDESGLPNGSGSDQFVARNRSIGVRSLITIPTIGWLAKSRDFACGFSVEKYGYAPQSVDPYRTDCGNGVRQDGSLVTGNDPEDTSRCMGTIGGDGHCVAPAHQRRWVDHLVARFGDAASRGVSFYELDNEPQIWSETHRDIHPDPVGYDEMRDRAYAYAAAIKRADPTAKVLGPSDDSWTRYFYSGRDAGSDVYATHADRRAHGDVPFVEWYLQQMKAYEDRTGRRILDYLDEHFYPQTDVPLPFRCAGGRETQALRLRSTRALWDPSYTDESYIGRTDLTPNQVKLLPRLRTWVRRNYPGTRTAVTEYNWGALEHVTGALAQADILGLFGRYGLNLAAMWGPPRANQPAAFAFRILRSALAIAGFSPHGAIEVWRYDASAPTSIVRQPDLPARANLDVVFPHYSMTLLVAR
jgi:hypothetical protein